MSEHASAMSIDPAWVARIVAEVVARLNAATAHKAATADVTTNVGGEALLAKVVDVRIIAETEAGSTLILSPKAVVTPAAKDEAKRKNIQLVRQSGAAIGTTRQTNSTKNLIDQDDQRRTAIENQLRRRGIPGITADVVLSDTPAREVVDQGGQGKRAVMIGVLSDVARFGGEVDPQVWVLDMKRLNMIAAVNVIASIVQFRKSVQLGKSRA
ncbi:hypothetical protein Poly51_49730 [Rubripirellula tenax]|uniref:Uncharacterized protein n=1 Tax=Rubripirellula tenax TaxID=2528015 RepID=A0A5C6EF78_9BACT|nr:hypothetical protein [Rubripirellula tenax]TWU47175.1 hypothetical protein Poly51_49730 [Rubripirellula tenax]